MKASKDESGLLENHCVQTLGYGTLYFIILSGKEKFLWTTFWFKEALSGTSNMKFFMMTGMPWQIDSSIWLTLIFQLMSAFSEVSFDELLSGVQKDEV